MGSDRITLREFLELRLDAIEGRFEPMERDIAGLRSVVEEIAVTSVIFESAVKRLDELEKRQAAAEHQVAANKFRLQVVSWVGGVGYTIMLALITAWLKGLIGG